MDFKNMTEKQRLAAEYKVAMSWWNGLNLAQIDDMLSVVGKQAGVHSLDQLTEDRDILAYYVMRLWKASIDYCGGIIKPFGI